MPAHQASAIHRVSPTGWSISRARMDSMIGVNGGRSVLIAATAEELPLELAPDASDASTPVGFTPASCDPHVLSETKKPYVFPLAVTVGDGEEVSLALPLDDAVRELLAALVQRVCTPGH